MAELFLELGPTPNRKRLGSALRLSVGLHAVAIALAGLGPLLFTEKLPEPTQRVYSGIFFADPPPPPPPPLPLGAGLARPSSRPKSEPPTTLPPELPPDRLVMPVDVPSSTPEPAVLPGDTAGGGSPTGSPYGDPEGMEGGVVGGEVGGVPGGVLGGVIGGTGSGLVPERDVDRPARPLRITKPVYPHEAFVRKVEGTVLVQILIDARGQVASARVVQSMPLLDEAAVQCVLQWLFEPAFKRGRPVASLAMAPVSFRIY